MAEHTERDEEERAWAVRLARAFLAPPARESPVVSRQAPQESRPPSRAVLVLAVVPLPVPAPVDDEQEGEGDG